MAKDDLIRQYPTKRVSPFDGMAVTAQTWADAHEYHRLSQQIQALFGHGPGILAGLQVLASDPPDSSVYIRPGIARDPAGQIIVISEAVRYDLARAEGCLCLLLSYGEGRPAAGSGAEGGANYIQAAYAVEAKPQVPEGVAVVELARIRRRDAKSPVVDAVDPLRPGLNEIDLRCRREIGAPAAQAASIAVVPLGKGDQAPHGRGASHLARALSRAGQRVWADDGVSLDGGLQAYTLVCLVGQGTFQLTPDEMNALYAYLQAGGTLFIESCRRDAAGAAAADAAFSDLLGSLGIRPSPLPQDHSLLVEPYLFAAPPPGFEAAATPAVSVSDGVILSSADYGCLWQGESNGRVPSREEIRAALEWGANIVAYALNRRGAAGQQEQ